MQCYIVQSSNTGIFEKKGDQVHGYRCSMQISADDIFKHFSYFSQEVTDILCKLSPHETVCMKSPK